MGRSGYSYDADYLDLWRGSVDRAIRGKRGQAFLRDLIAALDALPEKKLIAEELQQDGEVCAIGSVGLSRGIDMATLNPEDHDEIGKRFNIARCMVAEIEFINDGDFESGNISDEERFKRVREWAESQLIEK